MALWPVAVRDSPDYHDGMEAHLLVVGGKASKAKIALELPTLIGRCREAGLTIAHPMVSRRHCEVFEADGLLMVRDLGSLNGTLVEGRRVKASPLPPDAEFTVGPLTFRAQYHYEGDLSKLPAPVLAEPVDATSSAAEAAEMPDFQTIEAPAAALKAASSAKPVSPDDAFNNILDDLG
jgi:predicted component of type VI protein secretion system